jgi:hypothetical protein
MAISSPIKRSDSDPPEGILAGTIPYADLVQWITDFEKAQSDMHKVVIVNHNRQIIYHPSLKQEWEKNEELTVTKYKNMHFQIPFDEHGQLLVSDKDDDELAQFNDLKDSRAYLGTRRAVELSNGQQFAIIVQQDLAAVMGPLSRLRKMVYGLGGGLLLLGGVFLASNTYALYWFLRHQRETAAYV